ncbi:unnamed protein product [Schistocephalus solidus]|uniref:Uncharacterized protein n=1 Tax=Schistocephalus solidus TaxID=70667 RepID=A0A183T4V4_SCHSO|nr:unnamed protein product [Schistocephalus solidus]
MNAELNSQLCVGSEIDPARCGARKKYQSTFVSSSCSLRIRDLTDFSYPDHGKRINHLGGRLEKADVPPAHRPLSPSPPPLANPRLAKATKSSSSTGGDLKKVDAGFTFFWSGRPKAERRDGGVTSVIRTYIMGRLPRLPQSINDSLMRLHLPLQEDKVATIITIYDTL